VRRLLALSVLALAVALAAPAGASARSVLYSAFDLNPGGTYVGVSENYGFVGPVLAGDSILYARGSESQIAIARTDDGVTGRSIGTIRDLRGEYRSIALDASEQRVALAEVAHTCGFDCRTSTLVTDRVLAGPLDGPPVPVAGCGPEAPGCGAACFEYTPEVSVSGTAIAFFDRCGRRMVVRDDGGAGPPAERTFTPERPDGTPRVAGRYVAWLEWGPESVTSRTVVVHDWVTGQEAYRVDAPGVTALDVQADGKVAYALNEGRGTTRVAWASADEPRSHPGPVFPTPIVDVRIERDRIGVRARESGTPRLATLAVLGLDARELARHRETASLGGWDFDGTRIAWATHPCERAAIVAWDFGTDTRPPALPAGRCPVPKITVRSTGVRGRSFGLPMRCPAEPALGCRGSVRLVARSRSGRRFALGRHDYDIEPRRSSRVKIVLTKAGRAFVARHRTVTVTATAIGVSRSGVETADEFLTRTNTFRLASRPD
jgi:hypothetical protein